MRSAITKASAAAADELLPKLPQLVPQVLSEDLRILIEAYIARLNYDEQRGHGRDGMTDTGGEPCWFAIFTRAGRFLPPAPYAGWARLSVS